MHWRRYVYVTFNGLTILSTALLAAGEYDALRDFLEHSLTGAALTDGAVRDSLDVGSTGLDWKTDDGHCGWTPDTHLLTLAALARC